MTLYVAINMKKQEILLISDNEEAAKLAVDEARLSGPGEFAVLSASDVSLSSAVRAEVSMCYELDCVQETVQNALREKGVNEDACPVEFEKVSADIAADAYSYMIKYDWSEDSAIEDAMKNHEKEISALIAE